MCSNRRFRQRSPSDALVHHSDRAVHVDVVCIDSNGVTRAGECACIGAYRYPEAEVVWST